MTLTDAAGALDPPIPRRELARRLKHVAAIGTQYGRRGRRAALYPLTEIMLAHAAWVRERMLANDQGVCQNSAPRGVCPDEG